MGVRKRPDHACFTKWSEGYLLLVRSGLSATSSSKILDERLLAEFYYYWAGLYLFINDYKRISQDGSLRRSNKKSNCKSRVS